MMHLFTKQLFSIFFGLLACVANAQVPVSHPDTRPVGDYKLYLNAHLQPTSEDKTCYYMFSFLYKGTDVWATGESWRKRGKLETSGATLPTEGNPQPLQGTFKWFSKNGKVLLAEETFLNGRQTGETRVYNSRGKLMKLYDYSRKWENKPWSFYMETYEHGNLVKSGFMFFNENKGSWETICMQGCYISKDFR
jgi:antitoxin component YwqK of YwqJK toxin-antitoxin module